MKDKFKLLPAAFACVLAASASPLIGMNTASAADPSTPPVLVMSTIINGIPAWGSGTKPVAPGDELSVEYIVHNESTTDQMTNVVINDPNGGTVSCPSDVLGPAEAMRCNPVIMYAPETEGALYTPEGIASATMPDGTEVSALSTWGSVETIHVPKMEKTARPVVDTNGDGRVGTGDEAYFDIKVTYPVGADEGYGIYPLTFDSLEDPQMMDGMTCETYIAPMLFPDGTPLPEVAPEGMTFGKLPEPGTSMPNGSTITCSGSMIIQESDMQTCTIPNDAKLTYSWLYDLHRIKFSPSEKYYVERDLYYQNFVTATAESAWDCGSSINIIKTVNGDDANEAPGVKVEPSSTLNFEYIVTNDGAQPLSEVAVTDDQGVEVTCPKTELNPAETMTCTGNAPAPETGDTQYTNIGTVTGKTIYGEEITDNDPANAHTNLIYTPGISITKYVNGEDANEVPGIEVPVGSEMNFTFEVTNTSDNTVDNIAVTDDKIATEDISCPSNTLPAGEKMTCTAILTAPAEGGEQHTNTATVNATGYTDEAKTKPVDLTDNDPANAHTKADPSIIIVKKINGDDANDAPGIEVEAGSDMAVTYDIKNAGNMTLNEVKVTDDKITTDRIACPKDMLAPGEEMTCTATLTAPSDPEEQHTNTGTVTGKTTTGIEVTDDDPANAITQKSPEPTPEPSETPTPEPTPEPSETPTPEPSETPTPEPSETPTPEPTPEPSETPTPEPSETPTPTDEPKPDVTPEPTPTDEPKPDVTTGGDPTQDSLGGLAAIGSAFAAFSAMTLRKLKKGRD